MLFNSASLMVLSGLVVLVVISLLILRGAKKG